MSNTLMSDHINQQLATKKAALAQQRESFDIMVQTELYSENRHFEGNAIAVLTSMAKLKSELEILENINLLHRATTT